MGALKKGDEGSTILHILQIIYFFLANKVKSEENQVSTYFSIRLSSGEQTISFHFQDLRWQKIFPMLIFI